MQNILRDSSIVCHAGRARFLASSFPATARLPYHGLGVFPTVHRAIARHAIARRAIAVDRLRVRHHHWPSFVFSALRLCLTYLLLLSQALDPWRRVLNLEVPVVHLDVPWLVHPFVVVFAP